MGIFSKIFKKKKPAAEEEVVLETAKRILFDKLEEAKDNLLTKYASALINGNPVVLNLELLDIDSANKVIAFLSGAVYACEGYVHQINETVFLFGNSEVYTDGSVKKLLAEI